MLLRTRAQAQTTRGPVKGRTHTDAANRAPAHVQPVGHGAHRAAAAATSAAAPLPVQSSGGVIQRLCPI